jgi:hypothetical protein
MQPSLAQIQRKVGLAPKPKDIKTSSIEHLYFQAGLDARARHHDGSVHDMPLRHTTSGVQNHPRPDTRGSTTVPCTSRPPAPAGSPAPAGPGRSFCQFLAQIQVMARSAPEPGGINRQDLNMRTPWSWPIWVTGARGGVGPLRCVLQRGSATPHMVCQMAPTRTLSARHHPAPPARWPAVQDPWLRLSAGAEPHIRPSSQ